MSTVSRAPYYPSAMTPYVVSVWQTSRDSGNKLHSVYGRAAHEVTLGPASLRNGTMTYGFLTQAEALACEDAHAGVGVFTLTDSTLPAPLVYVVAGTVQYAVEEATRAAWTVTVVFQEVTT